MSSKLKMKNNSNPKNQAGDPIVQLTALEEDVLTILGERELYGLEILNELNTDRPSPDINYSSLYPALNRQQEKGLITCRWGDEDEVSGGGRRKYCKVTKLGRDSLQYIQQYRLSLSKRSNLQSVLDSLI